MSRERVGVLSALIIAVFAVIFTKFVLTLNEHKCEARSKLMDMSYKYGFYEGCMVEYKPGKWIPINKYVVYTNE